MFHLTFPTQSETSPLISSGGCIHASLKILKLPLLFSRQLSSTAPTAVTGLLSSDRRLPDDRPTDIICCRPGGLSSLQLGPGVRIQFPPAVSQVRTCLAREFAFLGREATIAR
jgi:hypothetical protein